MIFDNILIEKDEQFGWKSADGKKCFPLTTEQLLEQISHLCFSRYSVVRNRVMYDNIPDTDNMMDLIVDEDICMFECGSNLPEFDDIMPEDLLELSEDLFPLLLDANKKGAWQARGYTAFKDKFHNILKKHTDTHDAEDIVNNTLSRCSYCLKDIKRLSWGGKDRSKTC